MTKEQKDKILQILTDNRNGYVRDCDRRIAEEQGQIKGADYMAQTIFELLGRLKIEDKSQESEETNDKRGSD